jgi:glutathione S-transferase
VLEVTDIDGSVHIVFESAVIAEYLDEIAGQPLLPRQPLEGARQRAWVELGSATIGDIGKLYAAPDQAAFEQAASVLEARLAAIAGEIAGPWFAGERFGLVDAAFAPALRYLDVFDWRIGGQIVQRPKKVGAWSERLANRQSVRLAVTEDYAERLIAFVTSKDSYLGRVLEQHALEPAA